jgi:AraC-like DNA-binding protein
MAELPRVARAAQTMIASCLVPTKDSVSAARAEIAATLLERAKRYIRRHLRSESLSPDELCHVLEMSRTQLYRLFERSGGVAREIRLQRLLATHAALADPQDRRRIYQISEDFGFRSADEFGRAFRRHFGYTPRDARQLQRETFPYQPPNQNNDFRSWLLNLGR